MFDIINSHALTKNTNYSRATSVVKLSMFIGLLVGLLPPKLDYKFMLFNVLSCSINGLKCTLFVS